jgi:hypothetical protein
MLVAIIAVMAKALAAKRRMGDRVFDATPAPVTCLRTFLILVLSVLIVYFEQFYASSGFMESRLLNRQLRRGQDWLG